MRRRSGWATAAALAGPMLLLGACGGQEVPAAGAVESAEEDGAR